jgi:FkbM family methyltransferase
MLRTLARKVYDHRRFSLKNVLRYLSEKPRGVLHVGGNTGTEAEAYAAAAIEKVVWVEGHPDYFKMLTAHVSGFAGQEAHCLLVSDRDGERATLRVASNTGSSTTFSPSKAFRDHFPGIEFLQEIDLVSGRLDTYFAQRPETLQGCDFLVLDVEGAELKALRSLGAHLSQFRAILCEVSIVRNFEGGPVFGEIDSFLADRGFVRRALWIGYSSGDAIYVRAPVTPLARIRASLEPACLALAFELGLLRLRRTTLERIKRRLT